MVNRKRKKTYRKKVQVIKKKDTRQIKGERKMRQVLTIVRRNTLKRESAKDGKAEIKGNRKKARERNKAGGEEATR